MHKKLTDNKAYAQRMLQLRSSTVEPVLGTLINFLNMKRVNTRGIELANKHVLMAALTYNLKKYLKFIPKKVITNVIAMPANVGGAFALYFADFGLFFRLFSGDLRPRFCVTKIPERKIITRQKGCDGAGVIEVRKN